LQDNEQQYRHLVRSAAAAASTSHRLIPRSCKSSVIDVIFRSSSLSPATSGVHGAVCWSLLTQERPAHWKPERAGERESRDKRIKPNQFV